MSIIVSALCILTCYLIGSVPFAYILVKLFKNIDIRTVGSGNVGATNAGRVLGRWAFFLVTFLDALKGFLPVLVMFYIIRIFNLPFTVVIFAATAVILGHTFPLYLNFKGGKGVATSLGVFIALAPYQLLIAFIVFVIVVLVTRMISAGSIAAALAMAIAVCIMRNEQELIVFTLVLCFFVIFLHRKNIKRILNGTENRINFGK